MSTRPNYALILVRLKRKEEAEGCLLEASNIWRELIDGSSVDFTPELAAKFIDYAATLQLLGHLEMAEERLRKGMGVLRQLCDKGHTDLETSLAAAGVILGGVLRLLRRFVDMEQCLSENVEIWRSFSKRFGGTIALSPTELVSFAGTLGNLGWVRVELQRQIAAEPCLDESAAIYRHLIGTGRKDLAKPLACVLIEQGNVFAQLRRFTDAKRTTREAKTILEGLSKREQNPELQALVETARASYRNILKSSKSSRSQN